MFSPLSAMSATTANSSGSAVLEEVRALEAKGELSAAIINLRNAIRDNPGDPSLRLALGRILLTQGNIPHAETAFLQAREKGARKEDVLVWQAKIRILKGDFLWVASELDIDDALPDELKARMHVVRGQALYARKKTDEAAIEIEAAKQLVPGHPWVVLLDARRDLAEGKLEQGEQKLDQLIAQGPHGVEALMLKVALHKQRRETDQVMALLDRIVALRPYDANVQLDRAATLMALGQVDEADEIIDKVLKGVPNHPLAILLRAQRLTQTKKFKEAWERLQPAMQNLKGNKAAVLLASVLAMEAGQVEQAHSFLDPLFKLNPEDPVVVKLMAELFLRDKKYAKAVPLLEKVVAAEPDDARVLARLALAYTAIGKNTEAAELFEKAATLDPENQALKLRVGMARMAEGDTEAAWDNLSGLVDDPDAGPQASAAIASLHMGRGEWDKALEAARTYRGQMPDSPQPDLMLARIYRATKDTKAELESLLSAQKKAPELDLVAFELATHYRRTKEADKEAAVYADILARNPRNERALLGQISISKVKGESTEALTLAKRAANMAPESLIVGRAYVNLLMVAGQKKAALAEADRLVSSLPKSADAFILLSKVHFAIDQPVEGLAALRRTAGLTPQGGAVHVGMAKALIRENKPDYARQVLDRAVEIEPGLISAWGMRLADEEKRNGLEAALKLSREAEVMPGAGRDLAEMLTGDLYLRAKQPEKALAAYKAGIAEKPSPALVVRLARAHIAAGDRQPAQTVLTEWLTEHPDDLAPRMALADQYMAAGKDAEAIAAYEKVVEVNPRHLVALNNMAYLHSKTDPRKGLVAARRAWMLAKTNPSIADTYGWLLVRTGEPEKGRPLLELAHVLGKGKSSSTAYHLAAALAAEGQKEKAASVLEPLMALEFPELEDAKALYETVR
ncbi:XrtA/PEP-CTERM system TPR-repeat protein PrsT [Magnetospira sp. QH-2]|uniref:XrtA/PEP-CTERM system TPR-repeat protein PrsT n=1 Tax=Magnetospira sp. (strain QH-2) TaxID=1288970 RepID=UPI0005FA74A0|nr:XrtA/PEP-CTERM system TPR-repeat protein PrsT [Magnetospira sp. QH-2]